MESLSGLTLTKDLLVTVTCRLPLRDSSAFLVLVQYGTLQCAASNHSHSLARWRFIPSALRVGTHYLHIIGERMLCPYRGSTLFLWVLCIFNVRLFLVFAVWFIWEVIYCLLVLLRLFLYAPLNEITSMQEDIKTKGFVYKN